MDGSLPLLIYLLALAVAACLSAQLLRACGAPGWAILGGVLAGVLFGPTIFGRLAPSIYESTVIGGVPQREQLEAVERQQQADLRALQEIGAEFGVIHEAAERNFADRRAKEDLLAEARWSHQQPWRIVMAILVTLTLLAAGRQRRLPPAEGQPIVAAINIGLWASLLPGALAGVCMHLWWGYSVGESLLVAAAVMIGPWMLTPVDQGAADHAELGGSRLIQLAGCAASATALLTFWGAFVFWGDRAAIIWTLPLFGLVIGWFVPIPDHRFVERVVNGVLLPLLSALCAIWIELIEHFAFWPLLILLILSGDGRLVGAAVGAMLLGGRRTLRTMRLVMGSIACGPTQLAVLAVLLMTWSVAEQLPLAILFGAIVIEASVPARRSLAERLAKIEVEMREFEDDL